MRPWSRLAVVTAIAAAAIGLAAAEDPEPVPLYTGEDLERMFGPSPPQPSDPVGRSRPEDWLWVEQFLDRQYARIDADRRFELGSRAVSLGAWDVAPAPWIVRRPAAWGLGYPASVWWSAVAATYGSRALLRADDCGDDDHRDGAGRRDGGRRSGGHGAGPVRGPK